MPKTPTPYTELQRMLKLKTALAAGALVVGGIPAVAACGSAPQCTLSGLSVNRTFDSQNAYIVAQGTANCSGAYMPAPGIRGMSTNGSGREPRSVLTATSCFTC